MLYFNVINTLFCFYFPICGEETFVHVSQGKMSPNTNILISLFKYIYKLKKEVLWETSPAEHPSLELQGLQNVEDTCVCSNSHTACVC